MIKQIEVYDKLISQGKTEISLEANESFTKPKIKSPKSSISERVPSSSRVADNQESKVGMDRILGRSNDRYLARFHIHHPTVLHFRLYQLPSKPDIGQC